MPFPVYWPGSIRSTVAVVAAVLLSALLPAPSMAQDSLPAGFDTSFALADRRARAILFWQQCSATIVRHRASGLFGPTATAPREVHCERTSDGVPVGGVFDVDTGLTRVRRLMLVRLDGGRPTYSDPIDTARVLREITMEQRVAREIGPAWKRQSRYFLVVPVRDTSGVTEGWVIPVSSQGGRTVVTGGDMGFISDAAGRLSRIADRSATWKLATVSAEGPVAIASGEALVPTVSELVIARAIGERGREVTVTTASGTSTLIAEFDPATRSAQRWRHTPAARR
ncbi:MAG: hypothetical protein V4617_10885 [Gemmatimonadota bacterium]